MVSPKQRGKISPFPLLGSNSVPTLIRLAWSWLFDFVTSKRHKFIFDFMGEVDLKSSKASFGYVRSRLFLIARLALTRPVISS